MIAEAFVAVWLGVVAAQAAPGPSLAAVASVALGDGRRPALIVATGVALGVLVWTFAFASGLGVLLDRVPVMLTVMRLVGGSYLLFLGIRAFVSVWRGDAVMIKAENKALSDLAALRYGLAVVLTNPKAALLWAAVTTYLFGAGLTAAQVMAFSPLGVFSAAIVYGGYAWLFSTRAALAGYSRASRSIEAVFAGAFGILGGRLIFDGLRELRT